jgi:hypothetical protein
MMRTKTDVSGGLSALPVLRRVTSPAITKHSSS